MLAGLFLAAGLVVSSMLATAAWLRVRNTQFISVKGSARTNVTADLAVWKGSFSVHAATLLEAKRELQTNLARVEAFLKQEGATNFSLLPIVIEEQKGRLDTNNLVQDLVVGYRLAQPVRVESQDIDQISRLDRDSSELVEDGVEFTSEPVSFIYTKSAGAKIEMLAEAARDARARAEQIAGQGGRVIAAMHSAEMGVFQITPRYESQTSGEGMNDTTSADKTITSVVTATFSLK
jgi:hypothetical protein